jgi:hypothetical protein
MIFCYFCGVVQQTRAVWRKRGSNSPESLCKFSSFAPVRAAVEAPPAPSRHHVRHNNKQKKNIMKRLILIFTVTGIMTNAYSQSTLLWSKDFAAGLNNYYSGCPVIQTIADTIKVVGRINAANGQRLLIIKYDLNGDTISSKTYGSDLVSNNSIIDYKFDTTNHVYILQNEKLGFYKSKIILQKYSLEGDLIWMKQIQNPADTSYTPHSLGLINDTCIFFTAYKEYDYPEPGDDVICTTTLPYLYAYSSDGNQLWQREFDPNTETSWFPSGIFVHNDTAFFFSININNTSYTRTLLKVDINNNLTITNTELQHGVNNIQLTHDNNLLTTSGVAYRISKMNLLGKVLWTCYYGTNLPSNVSGDEIKSIIQDSNDNIYITGRHYGTNYGLPSYTNADILTIKYDKNGNLIWENRYEYGGNNADIGNTIELKNGQVYVGGNSQRLGIGTDYDYVVLKIDSSSGNTTGIYRYNGIENGDDAVSSLKIFDNGNVVLTGLSHMNAQYGWTTQLLSDVVLSIPIISSGSNLKIYPNPIINGQILTIVGENINSYSIISVMGQVVQQGKLETNDFHTIQFYSIKTGIYLLYLKTNKEILTRKIIVR